MKVLSIPLLLGVLLATGPVCAQENISKVNGSISAEPGQRYGKLDTVNGGIRVGEGVTATTADTPIPPNTPIPFKVPGGTGAPWRVSAIQVTGGGTVYAKPINIQ